MLNITSIYQALSSITGNDILNFIFKSNYYPCYYIFHAIYICLNIRLTTSNYGLSWYRSIILGYCFSICPRYLLQVFLTTELPEFVEMTSFYGFFYVWAALNIFPFDLIFQILNWKWVPCAIQVFDSFTIAQCIVITCKTATSFFEGQFLRILIIAICCNGAPILVDLFDRFIIYKRFDPLAYDIPYSKRIIAGVLITVFFYDSVNMHILLPILFVLHSFIDVYCSHGEVFKTVDLVLPNFWTDIATFNPNPYIE